VTSLEERRGAVIAALGGSGTTAALHLPAWEVDGDAVRLPYEYEGLGRFTEVVRFPGHDLAAAASQPQTAGALTLLHLAAATSYAKALVPSSVELGRIPPAAARMVAALLADGLAEFAVQNELFPLPPPRLHWDEVAPVAAHDPPDAVLVPIGGGKDSAVTAALARTAGWDAVGFAVNPRASMRRTAEAVGLELVTAQRTIDPRLLDWNQRGAFNGHVPVTAIVASAACVAATLLGRGHVLLSNEASSDEPTRTVDGQAVNHQFSKSSAFEALHVAAARELTGGATSAFSLLRPLPELVIAALFVHLGVPLGAVNSCNQAYRLDGTGTEWCGRCPKCLFVELMLAPFLTPQEFRGATGFDALAREDLVDAFGQLRDPERKPFECVGTIAEVQLAFDLLALHPAWSGHAAVVAWSDPVGRDLAHQRWQAMLDAVDPGALPGRYADALEDARRRLHGWQP
jgi:UDP-N-acetyl-alpha-D-muramoyl-L-alanyl-L-glutamate epimerase